jgi:hypothetical protein
MIINLLATWIPALGTAFLGVLKLTPLDFFLMIHAELD